MAASVPVDWNVPEPLRLEFAGFEEEAFRILDRLKAEPHIEQYRREKPYLGDYLKGPFRRYRDDLAVNWVLPNRLPFETERNVFSRLLKNDFGAGGSHHHLWMAFYRPGLRRLTDVQLSHSIGPEGFSVGLFVGGYGKEALATALESVRRREATFLKVLNELLATGAYELRFRARRGSRGVAAFTQPLDGVPEGMQQAGDVWVRTRWPRPQVVAWGPELVRHNLIRLRELWPLYRLFLNLPLTQSVHEGENP